MAKLADERSRRVVFLSHCLLNQNMRYLGGPLAREVAGGIEDYARSGFEVVGVVGIAGSPSCGVLTEELWRQLRARRIDVPFQEHDSLAASRGP